jgi:hypothetical protein
MTYVAEPTTVMLWDNYNITKLKNAAVVLLKAVI